MPSVFLSYSHKDEVWKDRLKTHLGVLELDAWDDRRIEAGADWFEEIQEAMARACVAVLLISADFLTSKFILGEEVPKLLERRTKEGLPVIPVIIRACAWKKVKWLQAIQARPRDDKTLAGYRGDNRDVALTKITEEILDFIERETKVRDTFREREPRQREDDFLDRVEAVCRLREPEAETKRYPSIGDAGDYLRVIRHVGEFIDIYPVGAVEFGLSRESFQAFLKEIDGRYRKSDPGLISFLIYGDVPPLADLAEEARAHRVRLMSFVEYQGLIDFRIYLKNQTERLANDLIYPPSLYVPQRMRTFSLLGHKEDETENALAQVREWLDSPDGRFLVLLGDFGTGKTFLLHELARRMGEAEGGLVPILLQMRSLEKGRSLDALLAQHFAQEGMEAFSPARFRYMLEKGRIALLFDGFDELALRVTYAKASEHFATLLQAATGSAKVVLTSRRQHFLSESQIKTALTQQVEILSGHRLAILQPFDRAQVRSFLVNFFDGDEKKAESRLDLIDRVRDLLGLTANPRLLGFIADLPENQLISAASEDGEITAAKLYELLLTRWLEFEFARVHPTGAPPGLSVTERWQAVTLLAMRLWQKTDRFVSLSDLSEEVAQVVTAVGPAAPDSEVAAFQVGSGTLLVRDDEGNFAFLHHSILEWLVAKNAADALSVGTNPKAFTVREISPLMADFLASLAGRERSVGWAYFVLFTPGDKVAKKNALLVLKSQKEANLMGVELSGQDLRGQDFSGQDLSGANLGEADLTEARLIGSRLVLAVLFKARVHDADFRLASLNYANLTEADLTGARLDGADLRGARLTHTCLRRASLLGTALDEGSLSTADDFGSALDISNLDPQGSATGLCRAVAWSPDGELVASAASNVIRLWDANNGRQIRACAGHQNWVQSVAFSPDGKSLVSGSEDKTVRLWRVDNLCDIKVLRGHKDAILSVAFSPDGKILASASRDRTIRLWRVDSESAIKVLRGHQKAVFSVAFSPDGKSLATGSEDKTVRLWEVDSRREIRALIGHEKGIRSVTFSPDGAYLASGSDDTTVRLWKVATGREVTTLRAHKRPVRSLVFRPDGKILASGSDDETVRLWQIERRESRVLAGHQYEVTSIAVSRDGKSLASGSYDRTVRLWDIDSGREVRALTFLQHRVTSVAFSPDSKFLAASCPEDRTVRLWRVESGREIRAFSGHQKWVWCVAFSPDGKLLASGSDDNTVRLWQMDSEQEIMVLPGHQGRVRSVAFSPDGKILASGSSDSVRLWQVDSGREIRALIGHRKAILSVAFSPDGKNLVSGSSDGTVRLWQVDQGREIRVLTGHRNEVLSVAFSPDGNSVASGFDDGTIRIWQADSGQLSRVWTSQKGKIGSVVFSPDGKSLASASADTTIRLWQVVSGREILVLTGHESALWSVAFSPDGKTIASGSDNGTIRLWDVAEGRCLAVLLSLPEGWVAYSPDGRYKFGGVPAGGFWHAASLCRFEIGELDDWVPGLRLADDASFFDLPPWKPEVRVPSRAARE